MIKKYMKIAVVTLMLLVPSFGVAMEMQQFSPEVTEYLADNALVVMTDKEIVAIQERLAVFGAIGMDDITPLQSKEVEELVNGMIATMERVAKEYMSGERVGAAEVVAEQELIKDSPCGKVDAECGKKESSLYKEDKESKSKEAIPEEKQQTFNDMLNEKETGMDGTIEKTRLSLDNLF